jgi:hypothetical protein
MRFKSTESTLAEPLQEVINAVRNHDGLLGGVQGWCCASYGANSCALAESQRTVGAGVDHLPGMAVS